MAEWHRAVGEAWWPMVARRGRCVAIPSVSDPLGVRLERADLLVRGGMLQVDPAALLAWLTGSPTGTAGGPVIDRKGSAER